MMDYLATWRKQKSLWKTGTVRMWDPGRAILQWPGVGQIYSKKWGQGVGGMIPTFARFFFFLLCIWKNEHF